MFDERGRVYSRQSAGAAIYGFLLKLVDLGLSGCWVGAYDDESIRTELSIPKNVQIEAVVPIGYGTDKDRKKQKRELEHAIYWGKWAQNRRPMIFEEARKDYSPTS